MIEIDKSHKMTEWENTIVTLISTPRFGSIRRCLNCEGEHAKTVCGEDCHDSLLHKCEFAEYNNMSLIDLKVIHD